MDFTGSNLPSKGEPPELGVRLLPFLAEVQHECTAFPSASSSSFSIIATGTDVLQPIPPTTEPVPDPSGMSGIPASKEVLGT